MKKSKSFKLLALTVSLLLILFAFSACSGSKTDVVTGADATTAAAGADATTAAAAQTTAPGEHTKVCFKMEIGGKDAGSFTMELYPEYAPITVENFLKLVNSGFYNGLTFHRVYEGFMAQGGDPDGTGTGGSDPIKGEFAANGVENTLSHTRGVVSMARRGNDNDSGSSQFFICYSDDYTQVLDGQYAAFGKVIEGMDVVDSFCKVEMGYSTSGEKSSPQTPIVITSAEVVK